MPISSVRFVPRDVPLPVVRVASVFANADKGDDEKNTDNSEDSRTEDSLNLEKVCRLTATQKRISHFRISVTENK